MENAEPVASLMRSTLPSNSTPGTASAVTFTFEPTWYAHSALLLKNNYNILLKNFRYKSSIFRRGENIIRMFFTKYDAPCLKKYRKIN